MAESSLYAGERDGGRVFQIGRIGFDQGTTDLGQYRYVGTLRTERIAPAGPGSLINFRRISIHILTSGTYTMNVRVWVNDARTLRSGGVTQEVSISGGTGTLREVTENVEIEAEGSHVQVEITVNSDDTTGLFLIEGIRARGRLIRRSASRTGESA